MRANSWPTRLVLGTLFLAFVYRSMTEFSLLNVSDGLSMQSKLRLLQPVTSADANISPPFVLSKPMLSKDPFNNNHNNNKNKVENRRAVTTPKQPIPGKSPSTSEALSRVDITNEQSYAKHSLSLKPDCVLSCCNPRSVNEMAMEEEFVRLLQERWHKQVVVTLATNGTLPALKIHVTSMLRNAPKAFSGLIVDCIGGDVYEYCSRTWPGKCVLDVDLSSKLKEFSVDGKSKAMVVSRDYVDIVWRKPEICKLAFLAGAQGCMIVDSDGVWFRDPKPSESTDLEVVWSSSDFPERKLRPIEGCQSAKARSVTNSGTVYIPNNDAGNKILDVWLASRIQDPMVGVFYVHVIYKTLAKQFKDRASADIYFSQTKKKQGMCDASLQEGDAMLDQDGLNIAVCTGPKGSMIYSSLQVLLNSVHAVVRKYPDYSICSPFFFHSTNCGVTADKVKCLIRNLTRWKEAGCGNFSVVDWGLQSVKQ